ncbi:MAG: hypothetical protein LBI60_02585, partial [Bacteroidales bacterium]|nr:hypothetical protein [Bacteroidales bacterium]
MKRIQENPKAKEAWSDYIRALEHRKTAKLGKEERQRIKLATGWERGADGKWRYEVPDGKYRRNIFTIIKEKTKGLTLSDVLVNDALYNSYPQLKSLPFVIEKAERGQNGFYDGEKISLNAILVTDDENQTREELALSTLVHEVQHAVQHIEGFAMGSNTEMFDDDNFSAKEYNDASLLRFEIDIFAKHKGINIENETGTERLEDIINEYEKALRERFKKYQELLPQNLDTLTELAYSYTK